ncbi:uncharacterized protein [Spinacia oleracea]|uniref:SKI-interacting protein SKIP SNW domain-containing protein n=1 Tax=Spinacia oleracea TaxID=3562 RepID=A0ABM3R200_SPIOL|nr:uncharacterized protein LOC130464159 [Spinacia oleracea]XP_056689648.1 uncharacterized protein LOC130464207 [Spinacia oleracea]
MAEVATTYAKCDVTRQKSRSLKLVIRKPAIKSTQIPQVKDPSVVDGYNKRVGTKVNYGFQKSNQKTPVSITGLKRRPEEVLEEEEEEGGPKPKRSKMDSGAILHWKPVEMNLERDHHKDIAIELSPSKMLRVAQLKSRFAETILKAQRYTSLQQGDKTIGQEDKESAAILNEESEIKRKRQEAREEARMAIRKVEQSVNFEDNFQVMKDFEALIGAPSRSWR